MKTIKKYLVATSAIALGCLTSSHAGTLAFDNFNTYPINVTLDGNNGGSGFGEAWASSSPSFGYLHIVRDNTVTPASELSYPGYIATSGITTLGGAYANFAGGYDGPAYMDISRQVDVSGAFSAYNSGGTVGSDGTTLWGSFAYRTTFGKLNLMLQGGSGGNLYFPLPVNDNANSLYIYKIQFGAGDADTIEFFNNPTLPFNPGSTPTSTSSGDFSFTRVGFALNGDTHEGRIDNVAFGTTPGDVVISNSSATPYTTWAISKGLDPLTDGAPNFDKDNDGSSNLSEYAFFTDPKSGSSLPAMNVATGATDLTLTYLRAKAATDVTYIAESSTELMTWSPTGITDVATGIENADTAEYRVTVPRDLNPKKFARIKVQLTTP